MTTTVSDIASARHREMAVEHLLFRVLAHLETREPGLLATFETSLEHLGDPAHDATKDDEAVRDIARRMLGGARRQVDDDQK